MASQIKRRFAEIIVGLIVLVVGAFIVRWLLARPKISIRATGKAEHRLDAPTQQELLGAATFRNFAIAAFPSDKTTCGQWLNDGVIPLECESLIRSWAAQTADFAKGRFDQLMETNPPNGDLAAHGADEFQKKSALFKASLNRLEKTGNFAINVTVTNNGDTAEAIESQGKLICDPHTCDPQVTSPFDVELSGTDTTVDAHSSKNILFKPVGFNDTDGPPEGDLKRLVKGQKSVSVRVCVIRSSSTTRLVCDQAEIR